MIISISRRTDIPACYSEWMLRRFREGFVLVRNPMNFHQVSRVSLSPEVVDGLVFWTKNPLPMMGRLGELEAYPYYVQFTLTAYGRDVEPNLPSKNQALIPAFQELSRRIGRDRVIWRYDPVFLSSCYSMEYHLRYFRVLAAKLSDYTDTCTFSFLDYYRNTAARMRPLAPLPCTVEQQQELAGQFARIAAGYGIRLNTCAEEIDLDSFGISHARCIDPERLGRIAGCRLDIKKDPNQRPECGCAASIDIGAYDTCGNGCLYCYANHSRKALDRNTALHDPASPLLFGQIGEGDVVKEREMKREAVLTRKNV